MIFCAHEMLSWKSTLHRAFRPTPNPCHVHGLRKESISILYPMTSTCELCYSHPPPCTHKMKCKAFWHSFSQVQWYILVTPAVEGKTKSIRPRPHETRIAQCVKLLQCSIAVSFRSFLLSLLWEEYLQYSVGVNKRAKLKLNIETWSR